MPKIGGQKVPFITVALVASESTLIGASLLIATAIRFRGMDPWRRLWDGENLLRLVTVVAVCELALYYHDLYDLQLVSRRAVLFVRLLQALGASCLLLAFLYYIQPELSLGRGVAAIAAPAILVIILTWRLLLDASSPFVRRSERVLVMGTGDAGLSVLHEMSCRPEFSYRVVGVLDETGTHAGEAISDSTVIGAVKDVERIATQEKIDRVVISLAERRGRMPVPELLRLKFKGIRVEEAHTLFERMTGRIMLEHLSPSWLFLSDGFRKSALKIWVKRSLDLLVSALVLTLVSPIMVLTSMAIWLETGGPILFRQKRTGMNGEEFEILKFRSMYQNSEASGPSWSAGANDRRITRVGHLIRRYRIDELPQMINVFRGHMSIVGPRPEQPYFCELLAEKVPFYPLRHSVRPGVTGWAQIKYRYGASIEESRMKLEYDLFYVKHLSLVLDVAIIFETGKVLLSGRGAK